MQFSAAVSDDCALTHDNQVDRTTPHPAQQHAFDPKNIKYQVSSKFSPDKGGTYPHPLECDGWVHAHNSIRGEIMDFERALLQVQKRYNESALTEEQRTLPPWTVHSMQQWYEQHYIRAIAHHKHKDDIVLHVAAERFHWPENMEAHHEVLRQQLEHLKWAINNLTPENEGGAVGNILRLWQTYKTTMLAHLLEEETVALPLLRAYFSRQECVRRIVKPILARGPKCETGSFIYYFYDATTSDKSHALSYRGFRWCFMRQEKIPFFLWYTDFRYRYRYYVEHVACHIVALTSGTPPTARATFWPLFS